MASNGEIVFQLFDIPSSTYMNAYMPAPQCLPTAARGRAQLLATRNAFMKQCPPVTNQWQPLGATANLSGVGFFNPVKTTAGALKNGAELRPLVQPEHHAGLREVLDELLEGVEQPLDALPFRIKRDRDPQEVVAPRCHRRDLDPELVEEPL